MLRYLLGGTVALLLASLFANLWLLQRARHFARFAAITRLDPLGAEIYPPGPAAGPADPARPRVVLFGDSRARDWPAPEGLPELSVINRGISGHSSAQALARYDRHIVGLGARVVIVQVGANDLVAVTVMRGSREQIIAQTVSNIRLIVERARAEGATVVLTTIFPLGDIPPPERLFTSDDAATAIDEANAALAELAGEGVVVLDTAAILADERGRVRREYQRDWLHINAAGYAALNAALAEVLRAVR